MTQSARPRGTRLCVVIPTFNERDTIGDLLPAVTRHADALVVDDNSPDGTAELARSLRLPGVTVLQRMGPRGFAASYLDGFAAAITAGYDLVGQMDADGSHPPAALPALVSRLGEELDVVLGSRYVAGGATPDWGPHRRLLSRGGGLYTRAILGLPIRDPTAGYRVWRATALARVLERAPAVSGYAFQIGTLYAASRLGLAIGEVPITFRDRRAGESKMGWPIVLEALCMVPRLRWGPVPEPRTVEASRPRS